MSISVACPECSKALKVKDEYAGRRLKCPGCGATFQIPAAAEVAVVGASAKPAVAKRAATVFDPAAAAANKAQRQREERAANNEGAEKYLPWQFILLGFLALPALLAAFVLCQTFGADGKPSTNAEIRKYCIPFLVCFAALTPVLIKSGRRRSEKINDADVRPVSVLKRFRFAMVMLACGTLTTLMANGPSIYAVGGLMLAAGLVVAVWAVMANEQ